MKGLTSSVQCSRIASGLEEISRRLGQARYNSKESNANIEHPTSNIERSRIASGFEEISRRLGHAPYSSKESNVQSNLMGGGRFNR